NGSPDNQSEVIQPYVDAGLVTYIDYPGKARQYEAYNAAVRDYKFFCRYIAFIDGDEFILPKDDKSILDVVDEVLAGNSNAAALCANWHVYGSSYHDTADYTTGVLERFTRCSKTVNPHVKSIVNPRRIDFFWNPHFARYFQPYFAVNERGGEVDDAFNRPPTADKIVVNHYCTKSREEFEKKYRRGTADAKYNVYTEKMFSHDKENDVVNDAVIKYRDARIKKFLPAGDIFLPAGGVIKTFAEINCPNCDRLLQAVTSNLLPGFTAEDVKRFFDNPKNRFEYFAMLVKFFSIAPQDFFKGRTEIFLTCFSVSSFLKDNFVDEELGSLLEEFSLNALCKSLAVGVTAHEVQLFVRELPKILAVPYPAVNELRAACFKLIPKLTDTYRNYNSSDWREFVHMDYLLNMLRTFDNYRHNQT
ncbi:MAG: glycosyltransferase family 92 protein, partial [Selenomonadaceae bacterium]|nr:glycosyltransferase family 92 protein [Selenomonadaceae bacterium]